MTTAVLDLGDAGRWPFRSHDELLDWIQKEREKWLWLEGSSDPADSLNRMLGTFHQLEQSVSDERARNIELTDTVAGAKWAFDPDGHNTITLAESELGAKVRLIGEVYGQTSAAMALALLRKWTSPSAIGNLDQFKGAVAACLPSSLDGEKVSEALSRERNAYRSSLRRALEECRSAEADRAAVAAASLTELRAGAIGLGLRLSRRFGRMRARESKTAEAAVSSINGVRDTYREYMQLRAPAEYWAAKSATHKRAEKDAMHRLQAFFLVALALTAGAFSGVGWFLISSAEIATAVYVVVSAGLATYTGLVFWAGRLLTRLYLSEHHLRKDADERRVMTTTYLALTQERGAEETDRQIILTALFRSSSDGIVKDEGGIDPSLAAALARFGMGR